MSKPFISIITPSFNQGEYLEECIESIISQDYENFELIVVDGGSTDNSVDLIKKYDDYIAWWVSEKDDGQSHAINKGIAHAKGNIFNWINSDDILYPGALRKVAECFMDDSTTCVSGITHRFDAINDDLEPVFVGDELKAYTQMPYNQHSTFYRMEFIREVGGVNQSLHYCMDKALWLSYLFKHGVNSITTVSDKLAGFRIQGESKTSTNSVKFDQDYACILNELILDKSSDVSVLLNEKYKPHNYNVFKNLNLNLIDQSIVESMVLIFLLNHNYLIYNKDQFDFAKRLIPLIDASNLNLFEPHLGQFNRLKEDSNSNSWFGFKVKRKINHLKHRR